MSLNIHIFVVLERLKIIKMFMALGDMFTQFHGKSQHAEDLSLPPPVECFSFLSCLSHHLMTGEKSLN